MYFPLRFGSRSARAFVYDDNLNSVLFVCSTRLLMNLLMKIRDMLSIVCNEPKAYSFYFPVDKCFVNTETVSQ